MKYMQNESTNIHKKTPKHQNTSATATRLQMFLLLQDLDPEAHKNSSHTQKRRKFLDLEGKKSDKIHTST